MPTEKEELEKYKEFLKQQNIALKTDPKSYKRTEKWNGIDSSYAGGEDGLEITVKIFEKVKVHWSFIFINDFRLLFLKMEYFTYFWLEIINLWR